jgi:hypothetical protein
MSIDLNDAKPDTSPCEFCGHQIAQHFDHTGLCTVRGCECRRPTTKGREMPREDANPWKEFLGNDGGQTIARVHVDGSDAFDSMKIDGRAVIAIENGFLVVRVPSGFKETSRVLQDKGSVLQEADEIITGARQQDYGSPLQSFTRIAAYWSATLGIEVTADQVALCMIGLKAARYQNGQQRDSLVDIAGYAGCIDLMKEERDQ